MYCPCQERKRLDPIGLEESVSFILSFTATSFSFTLQLRQWTAKAKANVDFLINGNVCHWIAKYSDYVSPHPFKNLCKHYLSLTLPNTTLNYK